MKLTARNPRALVFTFAFPLILIVLFNALNGNAEVDRTSAQDIRFAQFYTPAIAIFSLVSACYTTLVMGLANARDQGLLKRVRGTPLPMAIYLGAWVASAIVVGRLRRRPAVRRRRAGLRRARLHVQAPEAIVSLLLGALCLSALGVAVASLVKNADQAQPVVQLTFLPLSFISGIWFPLDNAPDWLVQRRAHLPALAPRAVLQRGLHPGWRLGARAPRCARPVDGRRAVRGGAPLPLGAVTSARMSWFQSAVVYQIYPAASPTPTGTGSVICGGSSAGSTTSRSSASGSCGSRRSTPRRRTTRATTSATTRPSIRCSGRWTDFDELLAGLHERGIKLVMDLVVNHTSDEHAWFQESRARGLAQARLVLVAKTPPNDWRSFFSGPAWELDRGERRVLPAPLLAQAAGPQLGEPGGPRGDLRDDALVAGPRASTASGWTSST